MKNDSRNDHLFNSNCAWSKQLRQSLQTGSLRPYHYASSFALDSAFKTCEFIASLFFFFFKLFSAEPVAYGNSQAWGGIEAYATATAKRDPSLICDLYCNLLQWILKPLSEARDQTHILMDSSRIRFCCHSGNS